MKGYLKLASGKEFTGKLETELKTQEFTGEVVFYTGMTGYQEVLTDPSYKGQFIVFTYPLIGNYGINKQDFESKRPQVAGVIVHRYHDTKDHYEAEWTLKEYLEGYGIPLLSEVDTRTLVKTIRSEGTMMAVLNSTNGSKPSKKTKNPVPLVTSQEITSHGQGSPHIGLLDFGFKGSMVDHLVKRGCQVTVFPYTTSLEVITAHHVDGILLSNGPGDPKELTETLPKLKKLIENYPTLGICLGHQLVALALGGDTEKLKFGHRGANQPVKDVTTGKVFMTSQNHSYVVKEGSLAKTDLQVRFLNVNDKSVEGLTHEQLPVITVQYHPEANPGPAESEWVFDEFLATIQTARREKIYA